MQLRPAAGPPLRADRAGDPGPALCLAPDLDPRYGKLFAYLQDDVTRKRPGPRPRARPVGRRGVAGARGTRRLPPAAPLVRYHLCRVRGRMQRSPAGVALTSRSTKRIVLVPATATVPSEAGAWTGWDGARGAPAEGEATSPVIVERGCQGEDPGLPCGPAWPRTTARACHPSLSGPRARAGAAWPSRSAATIGIGLVTANLATLAAGPVPFGRRLTRLCREALLQPAAIWSRTSTSPQAIRSEIARSHPSSSLR
jgi:hypothetical protein